MKTKTIENLIVKGENNINYQKLYLFMNQKLDDLYQREKITPLFDYQDIQYSAMIDLIYEIMPSLKNKL